MKNKLIYVALAAALIVCTVTGCTAQTANKEIGTVTDSVSEKSETVTDSDSTSAVSAEGVSKVDNQESDEKNESERKEEATTTKNSASNSSKDSKTTHGNTSTTTKKSSSAKETTTKRQTTTQKQTTTKKPTTTQKPTTTKKSGLSKSDVEWVQSQAHTYMRNKGIIVDSSVGSYSGRISTLNRTREQLLTEVKDWIDAEYNDCIASGYGTVYMYCKIENRSNGSYFIYVMYG
ncbi:MAG TPA: hypothetical protein IAA24_05260 [Candidatus Eubacterium faecigallinarum]|nr:hypothetical protein [Candidatus Eubacterium faecigallinarum]